MKPDAKWAARNVKVNLSLLSAMWGPDCSAFALRTSCDWNSWVFLFDDQFDEGTLATDLDAAQKEIEKTREIMNGTGPRYTPKTGPLYYVFQTVCDRIKESPEGYFTGKPSSENLLSRWRWSHELYFDGLIKQVRSNVEGRVFTQDIDESLDIRRANIAAYPAIVLHEWADGIDLPASVAAHPSILTCMNFTSEHCFIANDVYSYKKDLRLGVDHNLISFLIKSQGLSTQQAMDKLGELADDCYRSWYRALVELPSYGEETDRVVLRFLDICRNVALGNAHWGFASGRYLGKEGPEVRKTRKMYLPKDLTTLRGTEVVD